MKNLPLCNPGFLFPPAVLVLSPWSAANSGSCSCRGCGWSWNGSSVNRIRTRCGRFLKSPVSCLLPFLDPGCLRGTLNCWLAQPWAYTSSAWHKASSCWGSSPFGHSCRQHPLQASMGGWEEHLRIFFLIFIESQVLCRCWQVPGCCLVRAREAVVGARWDEPGRCGARRSATVGCGTVPPLPDSPVQLKPWGAAGPRAEVPRRAPQAPAPP